MKRLTLLFAFLSILALAQACRSDDLKVSDCDSRDTVKMSAGAWVSINAVVTIAFPDFFYIDNKERTTGMRVDKVGHTVKHGNTVNVLGQMQRSSSGEKTVAADTVTIIESNAEIKPYGVNNTSLGGWSWRWIKNTDKKWVQVWLPFPTLLIGIFVRTCGRVTQIDPDGTYLFIDDGSHLLDYVKTKTGVKVQCINPLDPSRYPVGTLVAVTGACGQYLDEVKGDPRPMIMIPNSNDIQIIPTN